jgi:hypothetical protein
MNGPRVRQRRGGFARGRGVGRLFAALVVILLALEGGGCASVKKDAKRIALENALSSYRQAIRWGYFPAAAGFLDPELDLEVDLQALENVRVTGYEVVQPGMVGPDDVAVQLVQIDYVLSDRQRLRKLADRQRWRYDDDGKAWWLQSGLPDFGAAPGGKPAP